MPWPALSYDDWGATGRALHRWTQVVGKTKLAISPWLNHSWHVPLYVSARGLDTSLIHLGERAIAVEFDFVAHRLRLRVSDGEERGFPLEPMSVAEFHASFLSTLRACGVDVAIDDLPSEIEHPIRFAQDHERRPYDRLAVAAFWQALIRIDASFRAFRTAFVGKASPVHFFWGSFDLAVTRFSGRPAPEHPGGVPGLADSVVREAYSHEVSSAGFWPGSDAAPEACFYSYAYPKPEAFERAAIEPMQARWSAPLGEWILPYEDVRSAPRPDETLMAFLQGTYRAAAKLGRWPEGLECEVGEPGRPRAPRAARST